LGDNGEYLFRPTRLIFRNWVPSQKPARLKVAGRRTQSDRFFCRAENFLKDSEFLNVRAVVRCRAVVSDLTDTAVHLKPAIANGCKSIVKPRWQRFIPAPILRARDKRAKGKGRGWYS